MSPTPGVHIETLANPAKYSTTQLNQACNIAYQLQRGRLILTIPPDTPQDQDKDES